MTKFPKDPFALIIAGVGGQGNVVLSQVIGNVLVREGFWVTVGETYGQTQRGGSVMSHVSISSKRQHAPLIGEGTADFILGMEPLETLRIIARYGNPSIKTIVNRRPTYPIDVAAGRAVYPSLDELFKVIRSLSARAWVVDATAEAQKMGNPIIANVILIGALVGSGALPIDRESFEPVLKELFGERYKINMQAIDKGIELIKNA